MIDEEFSKKELTFQLNNWEPEEYEDFKEKLFDYIKKTWNDVVVEEKSSVLYVVSP